MLDMSTQPTLLADAGGYWTTSWYDDGGARRYKRFGAVDLVSLAQAQREYGRWLTTWHTVDAVRNPARVRLTVDKLCDRYEAWASGYYVRRDGSPTGEAANVVDALRTVRETIGERPVDEVGPADLVAVRAAMVKTLARTTCNQRVGKVRAMFRWAAANGLAPAEVHAALSTVGPLRADRTEAREPEAVTPVARELVTAALPKMPAMVRAIVQVQLLCGCRPTEACMMRPCDIDRAGKVWVYRPGRHKGEHRGRRREIYLGPQAQAIITPLIGADLTAYLFSPLVADAARTTRWGKPVKAFYDRRAYYQAVVRACRAAGVAEWSPNQLRHTAATELRARYGLEVSRVVLGHTDADTTVIYAEADRAAAMRAMLKVG